jgi:hypothetical protein
MSVDLNLAKNRLIQKNLSLVIVKNGKVLFETESHGIGDLLKAINKLQNDIKDSSVADRIVGRAAALLFVFSGVAAVFAMTASDGGIEVLKKNNVFCEYERKVANVLNLKKTDVCPFEKLVAKISSPKKAYEMLKAQCHKNNPYRIRNASV